MNKVIEEIRQPERPHFIAAEGSIMLKPGTWYYRVGNERFDMKTPEGYERYRQIFFHKVTEGQPRRPSRRRRSHEQYPQYCVSRGRLQFIKSWSILTEKNVLLDDDGKEVEYPDWNQHCTHKKVELSEGEWETSWEQGIPDELYQKLYGPLKILV
jgi:hypothetical protein